MPTLSAPRANRIVPAMRKEELKHIFEDLRDARDTLANGDDQEMRLIKHINTRVREKKLGDLTMSWEKNLNSPEFPDIAKLAPYRYIRRVEEALLPEEPKSKASFDPARDMDDYRGTPHIGVTDGLLDGIKDLFKSSTPTAKWEKLKREKINTMMDSIEKSIKDRQKDKATKLRQWMNNEVQRWARELANRGPTGGPTGSVTGNSAGGATQFRGVRYTTY